MNRPAKARRIALPHPRDGVLGSSDVAPVRPTADAIRLLVLVAFLVWGALYAVWPDFMIARILSIGVVELYATDFLIAFGAALGVSDLLAILMDRRRARTERIVCAIIALYMLYTVCIVMPLSVLAGTMSTNLLRVLVIRFAVLLVPLTMGVLSRRPRALYMLLVVPGIVAIVPMITGVYNTMTGHAIDYTSAGDARFRALWGGAVLLFAWELLAAAWRRRNSLGPALVIAVSSVGFVLVNHRSAYIALLAVLPLVARTKTRVGKGLVTTMGGVAVLILVLVLVAPVTPIAAGFEYSFAKLLDFTSGTGADRLVRWAHAWQVFSSSPLNDLAWTSPWTIAQIPSDAYVAHNWVLEVGVSEGLVGLTMYFGVVGVSMAAVLSELRSNPIATGVFAYVAFFVIFCTFNTNMYSLANVPMLWLACGILLHLSSRAPWPGSEVDRV